jgi:hypothetical protein
VPPEPPERAKNRKGIHSPKQQGQVEPIHLLNIMIIHSPSPSKRGCLTPSNDLDFFTKFFGCKKIDQIIFNILQDPI